MTCKECERHRFCYGKPDKCGEFRNLIYENSGNYQIVSKYKNLPTEPRLCIIYMTWGDGQDPPQDAVQFATYSVDRGNFISQNNKVIPLKSIRAWCYVPR